MVLFSHKPDTPAGFIRTLTSLKVVAPVAAVATVTVVSVGVLASQPESDLLADGVVTSIGATESLSERDVVVSRSAARQADLRAKRALAKLNAERERLATTRAVKAADTWLWSTTLLNVWTASKDGEQQGYVQPRERVLVTGREADGRTEIVVDGEPRWVTSGYLVADRPKVEREEDEVAEEGSANVSGDAPSLGGSCTNGTSVSGGSNIIGVHQAVCAAFPEITTYGTMRSDGEHGQGLAMDIMVSGDRGWQVAEFVRANAGELGVNYVMYSQRIWSVQRSSEGWRYFSDRGSVTGNHYDHVHVTTY